MRPCVSISAHHTPRWPMHTRSTFERLRNDDVIDARRRKPAALRQVVNTAVAAGLFIDGA